MDGYHCSEVAFALPTQGSRVSILLVFIGAQLRQRTTFHPHADTLNVFDTMLGRKVVGELCLGVYLSSDDGDETDIQMYNSYSLYRLKGRLIQLPSKKVDLVA